KAIIGILRPRPGQCASRTASHAGGKRLSPRACTVGARQSSRIKPGLPAVDPAGPGELWPLPAMDRLVTWLIAHGGRVVGGVLLVSLGLGLAAVRLTLEFREGDLLPQGHPFIAVHNRYHRNFSEANVLSVMLEARSGTIFTAPILATIYRATEAVEPTMAGILTDALGVLAIAIVAIPALRQLAVTATLWLLSLIVTELLLNPIVYSRLRAPDPRRIRARETAWPARALDRLATGVLGPRGRWVALGGAAVVAAVAVALLPSVRMGDHASPARGLAAAAEHNQ